MEREHTRVHEENKTEAGKVRWVRPDRLDNVGGPVGRRWARILTGAVLNVQGSGEGGD